MPNCDGKECSLPTSCHQSNHSKLFSLYFPHIMVGDHLPFAKSYQFSQIEKASIRVFKHILLWLLLLLKVKIYFSHKLLHHSLLWSLYFNPSTFLLLKFFWCNWLVEFCRIDAGCYSSDMWNMTETVVGIWAIWLDFDNICSYIICVVDTGKIFSLFFLYCFWNLSFISRADICISLYDICRHVFVFSSFDMKMPWLFPVY